MELINGRAKKLPHSHPRRNAQIAQLLAEMLQIVGCKVIGPFMDEPAALIATNANAFDAAILDVKVNGKTTCDLADQLARKGTPFALVSDNQSPVTLKKYSPTLILRSLYAAENIYKVLCNLFPLGDSDFQDALRSLLLSTTRPKLISTLSMTYLIEPLHGTSLRCAGCAAEG